MEQWVTVRDAAAALGVSERTIYKRVKRGELERETRHGRAYILIECEVPNGSDSSEHESERVQNVIRELELRLKHAERERDVLRSELDLNGSERSELRHQLSDSLSSVRALTEQNERLTVLLANEQVQRLRSLPSESTQRGWLGRLFGRKKIALQQFFTC